jgi:hypothetical protein
LLLMIDYLYGPVQHDAFFKKYASKKFLKGKTSFLSSSCSTCTYTDNTLQPPWSSVNGARTRARPTSRPSHGRILSTSRTVRGNQLSLTRHVVSYA